MLIVPPAYKAALAVTDLPLLQTRSNVPEHSRCVTTAALYQSNITKIDPRRSGHHTCSDAAVRPQLTS